jgi:hypothetical protein
MNGLIVVGTTAAGGVVGGFCGLVAMMFWADLDGLGVLTWVPSGAAVGAAVGAYVGGQIVG